MTSPRSKENKYMLPECVFSNLTIYLSPNDGAQKRLKKIIWLGRKNRRKQNKDCLNFNFSHIVREVEDICPKNHYLAKLMTSTLKYPRE